MMHLITLFQRLQITSGLLMTTGQMEQTMSSLLTSLKKLFVSVAINMAQDLFKSSLKRVLFKTDLRSSTNCCQIALI